MTNSQYIDAYKKTQQSSNSYATSHEIVRTLMKELVNSMQKIVMDIQDERKRKQEQFSIDKALEEKNAHHKSKNLSKSLLDKISGIGRSRKRALLNHFGSAKLVEAASFEDLKSVDGIEEKVAKKIHDYFHED